MAVTINLSSGSKNITLSKVERPINVSKVTRQISLTHVGARGSQGETGATGPANSLSIGTVTTGDAGTDASATITGTAPSQELSLTIPRGDVGTTGATGAPGSDGSDGAAATIAVGTTTTGVAGSDASVSNSGTSSAATFDFTIPRGDTGSTGAKGDTGKGFTGGAYSDTTGEVTFSSDDGLGFSTGDLRGTNGTDGSDGAAATITVGTTSNLAPGSDATVSNSGTSSAATFDFGIPQGAVWYTGAGTPSTTHNDGDLYLNTSNGDVYKQASGSWGSSIANLTGPTGSAGSASGSDTQVQFNDGGSFAGDAGMTYNKTTNVLTASGGFSGNSSTATKLATARTIGGVSFDGSANINLPGVNTSGNQNTSGNAATATKLATARNINGVSFDGSADITVADSTKQPAMIPVTVSTAYNTATKVGTTSGGSYSPTAGDILYVNFTAGCAVSNPTLNIDGSGAKNIRVGTTNVSTAYLNATSGIYLPIFYDGTYYQLYGSRENTSTTYSPMSVSEGETGTATSSRSVRSDYLKTIIQYHADNEISSYLSTMNADITYGWQ